MVSDTGRTHLTEAEIRKGPYLGQVGERRDKPGKRGNWEVRA